MTSLTRDTLDRDEKLLIDTLRDTAEASRRLEAATCTVLIEPHLLKSRMAQVSMLTLAATLSRSHRAGVYFALNADTQPKIRAKGGASFLAEIEDAGGRIGAGLPRAPIIAIGNAPLPAGAMGVRLSVRGSRAGCVPLDAQASFDDEGLAAAAVFAASLAALEIFKRNALHESDAGVDEKLAQLLPAALDARCSEVEGALPDRLWFIGAGHLGQAAIFSAAICGPIDRQPTFKLQDHDKAIYANSSTQILLKRRDSGLQKIESCKRWLRKRGIATVLEPKSLDGNTQPDTGFTTVIAGLDRPEPRQLLERLGADVVIDAGIGGLASTFASFRVFVFPGPETAQRVFARRGGISDALHRENLAKYYARQVGPDPELICGARDVAGVAVGVPFIGTAVAAIVLSELLDRRLGGAGHWKLGGDLRNADPLRIRLRADLK